jgi:hypothetical protein
MSATNIKAGRAFVEIIAELDPLKKSLLKGTAELRSWGQSLARVGSMISGVWATIAGSAVVGTLAASVKAFTDVGSQLNDMAGRTGVAASELQVLAFAAKQTGASLTDVEMALRNMARNGFSVSDFSVIGQSIASIEDPSARAAKALEVFGKSGTKLLPMFAELNSLRAQSAALGPILSDEDVRRADELGDAFGALGEAAKRLQAQTGSSLATPLTEVTNILTGATAAAGDLSNALGNLSGNALPGLRQFLSEDTGFMRAMAGPGSQRVRAQLSVMIGMLESLGARGRAAAQSNQALADSTETVADSMEKAADATKQMADAIESGEKRRASLVREFETPREAFERKQREIEAALAELQRTRAGGFISQEQFRGESTALHEARRRNMAKENERLARHRPAERPAPRGRDCWAAVRRRPNAKCLRKPRKPASTSPAWTEKWTA